MTHAAAGWREKLELTYSSMMQVSWQSRFLDALQALDATERPHGLYGVRFARAIDPARLPTLAQVLLSPELTNFIGKFGYRDLGSDAKQDQLLLLIDQTRIIEMQVLDAASTKVRHFGSSYRLDTHNRKTAAAPPWNLEKLVPKLAAPDHRRRHGKTLSHCLLVVAHASAIKPLHAMLGRALEEDFLRKYAIVLDSREWQDQFERGFHSGLYLWTSEPEG